MEKSMTLLLLTLAVSVMSIPIAYLVGQRSGEERLQRQFEEERAHWQSEQEARLVSLRRELEEATEEYKRAAAAAEAREEANDEDAAPEGNVAEAVTAPEPTHAISKETYASATLGMTYDEVVAAFGREGTMTFALEDEAGTVTRQYVWQWTNAEGAARRVRLSFENGRLDDKFYVDER